MRVVKEIVTCDKCAMEVEPGLGELELRCGYHPATPSDAVTLDLCSRCALELHERIEPWIAVGRALEAPARPKRRSVGRDPLAGEIRAWATARGMSVSARGRIPAEIRDQYHAAVARGAA